MPNKTQSDRYGSKPQAGMADITLMFKYSLTFIGIAHTSVTSFVYLFYLSREARNRELNLDILKYEGKPPCSFISLGGFFSSVIVLVRLEPGCSQMNAIWREI
jgi:hypothetical protein